MVEMKRKFGGGGRLIDWGWVGYDFRTVCMYGCIEKGGVAWDYNERSVKKMTSKRDKPNMYHSSITLKSKLKLTSQNTKYQAQTG
jgi:hypothetical protein